MSLGAGTGRSSLLSVRKLLTSTISGSLAAETSLVTTMSALSSRCLVTMTSIRLPASMVTSLDLFTPLFSTTRWNSVWKERGAVLIDCASLSYPLD